MQVWLIINFFSIVVKQSFCELRSLTQSLVIVEPSFLPGQSFHLHHSQFETHEILPCDKVNTFAKCSCEHTIRGDCKLQRLSIHFHLRELWGRFRVSQTQSLGASYRVFALLANWKVVDIAGATTGTCAIPLFSCLEWSPKPHSSYSGSLSW